MNILDKIAASDSMQEWYAEGKVVRGEVGLVAGGLGGMFVALLLDTFTPLATPAWTIMWALMPVVVYFFPAIARRHGLHEAGIGGRKAMVSYLQLDDRDKAMFPPNTLQMLRMNDYEIVWAFEKGLSDLRAMRYVEDTCLEDARRDMKDAVAAIKEVRKTYDELG